MINAVYMEPSEGLLHGAVLHEALYATGVYETMQPYPNSVHYAPLVSSIGLLKNTVTRVSL